jgi:hypothetical protein
MKTYLAVLVALVDSLYVHTMWFFWWVIIGTKITRVMDQASFESESRSGFSLFSQSGSSFNQVLDSETNSVWIRIRVWFKSRSGYIKKAEPGSGSGFK